MESRNSIGRCGWRSHGVEDGWAAGRLWRAPMRSPRRKPQRGVPKCVRERGGQVPSNELGASVAAALVAASCGRSDSRHLGSGRKVAPALNQLSALPLIDDLGDHGTFDLELRFDVPNDHVQTYHGRYGTLSNGVLFTQFDIDIGLVNREVRRLIAHRRSL